MKIDINFDETEVEEDEDFPEPEHADYPKKLEALGAPNPLTIDFYRGDTKKIADVWKVIPEWCGEPTSKGTTNFTENSTGDYRAEQLDYTFKYRGNDFLVPQATIEAEYGSANQDRWERLPLVSVDVDEDRDVSGRWTYHIYETSEETYSDVNLRVTLKKKEDETTYKFDTCPDLKKDGTQKGNWKHKTGEVSSTDETAMQYKVRPSIPLKFGIQVQEVGTKAMMHYLYQSNFIAGGPVGYTASWLEPEGILFSPFDTTDTGEDGNYKVTRQPSFTADEVSGKIIDLKRKQQVELYLMPRRWAYFRERIIAHQDTPLDIVVHETCANSVDIHYPEISEPLAPGCALPEGTYFQLTNFCEAESDCDYDIMFRLDAHVINCEGSGGLNCIECSIYDFYTHHYEQQRTYAWQDGQCVGIGDLQVSGGITWCGPPVPCETCYRTFSYSVVRTIQFPGTLREQTYDVCLWWDSPPINFRAYGPEAIEDTMMDVYGWNGSTAYVATRFTEICDESKAAALEHRAVALPGESEEDRVKTVIGGYNSIHTMFSSSFTKIRYLYTISGNFYIKNDWNLLVSSRNGGPFLFYDVGGGNFPYSALPGTYHGIYRHTVAGQYHYLNDNHEDMMTGIMNHSEASRFWTAEVAAFPDADIDIESIDDYTKGGLNTMKNTYGVGISPNKTGALCAVIKIGSKVFYVWRKTDETFTERDVLVAGPSGKPNCDFIGRWPTNESPTDGGHWGFWDTWSQCAAQNRKITYILRDKSVECKRRIEQGIYREDYGAQDKPTTWIVNQGSGNVELEMPVYLLVSKAKSGSGWATL